MLCLLRIHLNMLAPLPASFIRMNISWTNVLSMTCSPFAVYHLFHASPLAFIVSVCLNYVNSSPAIWSYITFYFQPASPIRSEIGVKLGGTRCNLIITRLNPWMRLHASKKKKMVLREESSTREKPKSSDHKAIMWTATISAPEMTIMVYDLNGLPFCHVRLLISYGHLWLLFETLSLTWNSSLYSFSNLLCLYFTQNI